MMANFFFILTNIISFSLVIALPPNNPLHTGLKGFVNPNGNQTKYKPDPFISKGKHGIMIPFSVRNATGYLAKQDDYTFYPLGNTILFCDPIKGGMGTCFTDKGDLSVLIECTTPKNQKGELNWGYVFINDQGLNFEGFGDLKGLAIPKDIPPPPKVNGEYPAIPLSYSDQIIIDQDWNIIIYCPPTHFPS